jgi:NADH-quinone oxidoreductase subunit M
MDAINQSILTAVVLVPLAGAVLVTLVPDRFKLPNWIALLTTLLTFLLTLHLPAHFIPGLPGFQFEINYPWIESPAIFYHVGVDGLSLWLVVLVGLLAPVGVIASWSAINERRKVFYALFLVQQTAMFGVFADGDPNCDVWAQGRTESRAQILPVHVHSLGSAAGGHSVDLRAYRKL